MVPGAKRKNSRIDGFINVQICVLSNDQYEVFGNLDAAHFVLISVHKNIFSFGSKFWQDSNKLPITHTINTLIFTIYVSIFLFLFVL